MSTKHFNFAEDLKSGLIVSLVALPLCLGIALASGAPLLSGIVAGVLGGIVVGLISNSQVSVSGPAAGLAVIVLGAIQDLGSFNLFLSALVVAGGMQLLLGLLRLGGVAKYINHAVIEGMLTSIGILIILKQIPYALGFVEFKGYLNAFENPDALVVNGGAVLIGIVSLFLFIIYNSTKIKNFSIFKYAPYSIFVVLLAAVSAYFMKDTSLALASTQFVNMGGVGDGANIWDVLQRPDFSNMANFIVLKYGFIIAAVASIETLLCIEAGDKLDRFHRKTSPNQELVAQGVGNIISGMLGGLAITSVIVRTSVNIQSGATSKLSAIFHGLLLLACLFIFPGLVTAIPLAVLACILINAGYHLAHPKKILNMARAGLGRSLPYFVTIIVIVAEDLLIGVIVGQILSFILHKVFKMDITSHEVH